MAVPRLVLASAASVFEEAETALGGSCHQEVSILEGLCEVSFHVQRSSSAGSGGLSACDTSAEFTRNKRTSSSDACRKVGLPVISLRMHVKVDVRLE